MNAQGRESGSSGVVILGGGTAGWLTAAILNRSLPNIAITVVESPGVPPVGVGEATIPTLTKTLRDLGIPEGAFLRETNATFKHAILFRDWLDAPGSAHPEYYHAFEKYQALDSLRMPWLASAAQLFTGCANPNLARAWLRRFSDGAAQPYAYETGIQAALCDRGLAPKMGREGDYNGMVPYAYHFEADRFGAFLAETCVSRGVRRILAHVRGVRRRADGDVAALVAEDGRVIAGSLFVDCTGFRSELIGREMQTPFVSYSEHLLCDRAVAVRMPHSENVRLRPYTTASATACGWIWDLDVRTRRGAGHVYSSIFATDDEAILTLRDHLGGSEAGFEPRIIRFDPGRRERMWKNNVVAIGLSGGFLEPLESTGIYLIEMAAALLASLNGAWHEEASRTSFNEKLADLYDEIRDFLVLHYFISKRADTAFWREVREERRCPPSLAAKLEHWAHRMPEPFDTTDTWQCFWYNSYRSVLYGMHKVPAMDGEAKTSPADRACADLMSWAADFASDRLPSHEDGLASSVSTDVEASSASAEPANRYFSLDLGGRDERVLLTAGTVSAGAVRDGGPNYERSALVPLDAWKPAGPADIEEITVPDAPFGRRVSIVAIPLPVVESLREISARETEEGKPSAALAKRRREVMGRALAEVVRLYGDPRVPTRILGFGSNPAGLTTTTTGRDGRRIGMHVDSWSHAESANRGSVDNRLCVNVGESTRRLLFVPVSFEFMVGSLAAGGVDVRTTSPTDIGRLYLSRNRGTPIVALQIGPGEAYIAPTENMVHDGSTLGCHSGDTFVTFLGRFSAFKQPEEDSRRSPSRRAE